MLEDTGGRIYGRHVEMGEGREGGGKPHPAASGNEARSSCNRMPPLYPRGLWRDGLEREPRAKARRGAHMTPAVAMEGCPEEGEGGRLGTVNGMSDRSDESCVCCSSVIWRLSSPPPFFSFHFVARFLLPRCRDERAQRLEGEMALRL